MRGAWAEVCCPVGEIVSVGSVEEGGDRTGQEVEDWIFGDKG